MLGLQRPQTKHTRHPDAQLEDWMISQRHLFQNTTNRNMQSNKLSKGLSSVKKKLTDSKNKRTGRMSTREGMALGKTKSFGVLKGQDAIVEE